MIRKSQVVPMKVSHEYKTDVDEFENRMTLRLYIEKLLT